MEFQKKELCLSKNCQKGILLKDTLQKMLQMIHELFYQCQKYHLMMKFLLVQANSKLTNYLLQYLLFFQSQSKIKHALLLYITKQTLAQKEKKEYVDAFKALDVNNDGTITKVEILKEYKNRNPNITEKEAEAQVEKIVQQIDVDNSGIIDIDEFVTACISAKNATLSDERIKEIFKDFDLDGNGKISRQELETILGGMFADEHWKEILDECDKNGDGEIDQQEFLELLKHKKLFSI